MTHLCLFVESEPRAAMRRRRELPAFGVRPYMVDSIEVARQVLRNWRFDGIVVNTTALGLADLSLLSRLHPQQPTPLLLLSEQCDEAHQIVALESGATDLISSTASTRLIATKLRRLLEVTVRPGVSASGRVLRFGPLALDLQAFRATVNGESMELTPYQFDLLALLASRPGDAISREEIVQLLRGGSDSRVVDVHISRLRKRLEQMKATRLGIRTVRSRGYALTRDESSMEDEPLPYGPFDPGEAPFQLVRPPDFHRRGNAGPTDFGALSG